jgi:hypothetical protein
VANFVGHVPRYVHPYSSHKSLKKILLNSVSNTTNENHAKEPNLEKEEEREEEKNATTKMNSRHHKVNTKNQLN